MAFFLAHNGNAYNAELGLVTQKGEPPRTSLYFLFHTLQPPSLLFGFDVFQNTPGNVKMYDNVQMKIQLDLIIKAAEDYKYFTSTQNLLEASFDFSYTAQIVKFLSDNDIINYIICLVNTIIKANIIHWYKQMTRGILAAELYIIAHRFDIEKRHWEKY